MKHGTVAVVQGFENRYSKKVKTRWRRRAGKPEPTFGLGKVTTIKAKAKNHRGLGLTEGASWHCHRTASRPRLAAAADAIALVNIFKANSAVARAARPGCLAVRALGDVTCC